MIIMLFKQLTTDNKYVAPLYIELYIAYSEPELIFYATLQ